jgi:hypothetical protein
MSVMSYTFPYWCLLFRMCVAMAVSSSLFLILSMCSLNLIAKDLPCFPGVRFEPLKLAQKGRNM